MHRIWDMHPNFCTHRLGTRCSRWGMHVYFVSPILEGNKLFGFVCCGKKFIVLRNHFLKVSLIHQIPCRIHHASPSIAATLGGCQASSIHLRSLSIITSGGPRTSSRTSSSPFHSHNMDRHCAMPTLDHHWDNLLLHLLWALPW